MGLRLPAPFEPHHGAARHQRGAHPSAPHSGPRHRRGHGGEVLDQDRHAGAARRVREGHGGALRREPSGPLPGHAGRLARVLQGARDAARSVRGHHDPAGFGHGSGVPGHLGGGARHGRRQGALPAHHAYRQHRGHRGRVRRRRAAEVPAVRRHVGVPPLEELPAQPPARVPEPRGRPLRRRLQPRPGQDCHRQRWPVRQGHRQRHAVDPRLSARGPHGLHLLRSGRGVRVRGRHGAHRPVRPAHRGVPLHRPARRQPLRHAHRHGRRRHVAVPDSGEHRHGLRPYAHHGHPAALRQLRLLVHGRELRAHRAHWLGVSHTSTQSGFARTPSHGRKAS